MGWTPLSEGAGKASRGWVGFEQCLVRNDLAHQDETVQTRFGSLPQPFPRAVRPPDPSPATNPGRPASLCSPALAPFSLISEMSSYLPPGEELKSLMKP